MKTKRSSLRNSVVENNNEKTAVYSQNGSITDIMATDDGKFQYSTDGGQSFEEVSTQVDNTLSTTSENPVQNKVITNKFNDIYNANTHTLTVENAQIDGNITDGTNSITVAELTQTKPKLIGTYSPNPDTSEKDTTSKYPELGSNSTTLNFDTEIPFVAGKFYVVVMKSTGFGTSRPAQWNGMYFKGTFDISVCPIFNGVIGASSNNTATVTPSYLYIANKQQFVVTTNYSRFLVPNFSFSSLQFDVYEM